MIQFWNERYSKNEYVYGELPNVFLAAQLEGMTPGKIVLPCEGEGRNAVFAAQNNWDVLAFDSSESGQKKALQLAAQKKCSIKYLVEDAMVISFPDNSVDVVALIFAHFPPFIRKAFHKKVIQWLKPGGKIILEAFHPNQLNYASGGPKELNMLYTTEMLAEDFSPLHVEKNESMLVELNEGAFHQGSAAVVQFVGVKK